MSKKFIFRFFPSLTKDFVLIYRISLLGMFIVGCLFIKFSLNQERQKIEEKISVAANQVEKSLTYNVDYLKYQIFYATNQIQVLKTIHNKKEVGKILSSFAGNINNQVDISIAWNAFSWVDNRDKLVVDGTGGVLGNPIDLSDRDYLEITSKFPNKLVFGKPVIGALSKRLIIPVATGVFSENNSYLGTLVFGLDVERILSKLEKLIGNETLSFVVMRGQNIAFASDNFGGENASFAQKISANFSDEIDLFNAGKVVSSQSLFLKDDGFIYLQSIKNSPLKILVFHNKEKSRQQIIELLIKQSFFVFLVLFACVVLFQKIYQKIVRPVQQLSKLASKISKKDFDFTIERPSGKELSGLFSTLNSVKDILQREEVLLQKLELSNEKLSRANEAKAELLAKSSHDIKNYVFGIHGLSDLILEGNKQSKILRVEDQQMLETIADQSEELMHFVEDLLDTNRQETGEFSLEKIQVCDIAATIERIVLLNKSLAIRHDVSLETKLENKLPKLKCDIRRMKQILVNLITNAIKYSLAKTVVTITAKYLKAEGQIYIEITDEGIGMTPEEVEMLLLGQGGDIDKSQLKNVDSYGIGMAITLKLIKMHHGKIIIESEKGVGTKVKLYFDAHENLSDSTVLQSKVEAAGSKSILLVEDNPVNIKITSKILRDAGYKVNHVENGQEALEILDQQKFDLVLMDGEMPIMNGYDTAKNIREGKYFKNFKDYKTIPIVALMASSDPEVIAKALSSGANSSLEKTIVKADFLAAIARILR